MHRIKCSILGVGPLEKLPLIFFLQLSFQTQFAKAKKNKIIANNQCEKHKKMEFIAQGSDQKLDIHHHMYVNPFVYLKPIKRFFNKQ